jgi:hypothetical protein
MAKRRRTNARSTNLQVWYEESNQILTGCAPAKVSLKGSWVSPRHYFWVGVTLLSKLYHDDTLTDVDLITLTAVHSWLECRLRWLPFKYSKMVSSISLILNATGSRSVLEPDTVLRLQTILTSMAVVAENPREYHSRLSELARLYNLGLIRFTFPPADGVDEERSPSPPRIRGYRDKGSARPLHKWLPTSIPVTETEVPSPEFVTKLEEMFLPQRTSDRS